MQRLKDRVPPANSLIVFEAVARNLSFTRAAQELLVTQAAVSRQVQIIEDYMGEPLFLRKHRAIELTPAGTHFQNAATMGLQHIANAADELRQTRISADVTITSSVTFASYWLMSRIARFRAEFDDVDIRLVASAKASALAASNVDLAVRYGRGEWPGAEAHHLFDNEIFPICAPAYLEKRGSIEGFADLAGATLLHLEQFDKNWVTWESWLKDFGYAGPLTGRKLSFDHYTILLHAAVRGEGVALCGGRLAEDMIAHGELVRPIAAAIKSDYAFYLLHTASRPLRPAAMQFRDWLLQQSRGAQET